MSPPAIIVMGASLGGFDAFSHVFSKLPPSYAAPIAVVQHRRPDSDSTLENMLSRPARLRVVEAEDRTQLRAGEIYVAPGGYHMLVDDGFLSLSVDEPVVLARPSIDVLFESAADTYRERCVGVLLTGASEDGARGLFAIGQRGGCTIVQDPDEAASNVAPRAALALFRPQHIVRLSELSDLLLALAGD